MSTKSGICRVESGWGLSLRRRYATRLILGHGNRGLEVHGYPQAPLRGARPPWLFKSPHWRPPNLKSHREDVQTPVPANGVRAHQPKATPWETSLQWHSPPCKGGGGFGGLRPFGAPECSDEAAFPGCYPGLICWRALSARRSAGAVGAERRAKSNDANCGF